LQNPQRMMRFLNVYWIGKYLLFFFKSEKDSHNYAYSWALKPEEAVCTIRSTNVDIMMTEGLLTGKIYILTKLNALKLWDYKLFNYLDKEFTLNLLSKKSRKIPDTAPTRFKRDENTKWFDFETPYPTIIKTHQFSKNKNVYRIKLSIKVYFKHPYYIGLEMKFLQLNLKI
jgi:tRNA dimethylallyltransferase